MADIKISQLPSATTPLTGLEEVPLVQSGTTKKATVIDLVTAATVTTDVLVLVRNTTGSPLSKGTVVYINGATGQTPTVAKALASSDATSAQTLGMVRDTIANNSTGYVVATGLITDIDTSAYTDGAQLYLSGTTAGAVTSIKPYAPIHLVYVGVVEHAHPTQGKIFVKVQNGYELDELHNVSAQTPSNGQTLVYNSTSQLWQSAQLGLTNGVTGVLPVANGGSGTATPSLVAGTNVTISGTWPNQTVNASGGGGGGDVTGPASSTDNAIVRFDGTSGKLIQNSGMQINDLGEVSVGVWKGTEIGVAYGGTGAATLTGVVKGNGTSAFTAGSVSLTSEVTGTLPVGNGGTGAATFAANNVLLGNGTSAFQVVAPGANGNVLTSNGTTWTSAAISGTVYPGAGMAVSTGSAWGTSKNTPAGDVVGTSDSQTLTNKTLTSYTETVFTITDGGTVNLNPNDGPIQLWTLGANRTPGQTSWSNGQSILLMVDDGTARTITWSTLSVTWKTNGGTAPTLNTSGYTVIVLWKVGGVIYGARVGDA